MTEIADVVLYLAEKYGIIPKESTNGRVQVVHRRSDERY